MKPHLDIEEKFFKLIQFAVGRNPNNIIIQSDEEWAILHRMAYEQSLLSVILNAVDNFTKDGIKPPPSLLYIWIGESEAIRHRADVMDSRCEQLTAWFKKLGYPCCIIKGQGVARLYTHPKYR